MSFIVNGNLTDTLDFKDITFDISEKRVTVYEDGISIINNEDGVIDLTEIDYVNSPNGTNISKVIINIDDLEKYTLIKTFKSGGNSFYVKYEDDWAKKNITFNFPIDKIDGNIVITLIFENNDKFFITIPFKVVFKTIEEMGIDFILMDAKLTNSKSVSYVFKNKKTDTVVLVKKK